MVASNFREFRVIIKLGYRSLSKMIALLEILSFLFSSSPFIVQLFPEDVRSDKRGRPTTASSKIKVTILTNKLIILRLKLLQFC